MKKIPNFLQPEHDQRGEIVDDGPEQLKADQMKRRGGLRRVPEQQRRTDGRADQTGAQTENRIEQRRDAQRAPGGGRGGERAKGIARDQRALLVFLAGVALGQADALGKDRVEDRLRRQLYFSAKMPASSPLTER